MLTNPVPYDLNGKLILSCLLTLTAHLAYCLNRFLLSGGGEPIGPPPPDNKNLLEFAVNVVRDRVG